MTKPAAFATINNRGMKRILCWCGWRSQWYPAALHGNFAATSNIRVKVMREHAATHDAGIQLQLPEGRKQ